jgi:hypothetical protein
MAAFHDLVEVFFRDEMGIGIDAHVLVLRDFELSGY